MSFVYLKNLSKKVNRPATLRCKKELNVPFVYPPSLSHPVFSLCPFSYFLKQINLSRCCSGSNVYVNVLPCGASLSQTLSKQSRTKIHHKSRWHLLHMPCCTCWNPKRLRGVCYRRSIDHHTRYLLRCIHGLNSILHTWCWLQIQGQRWRM